MYAQNAASVNEFLGHSWDKVMYSIYFYKVQDCRWNGLHSNLTPSTVFGLTRIPAI